MFLKKLLGQFLVIQIMSMKEFGGRFRMKWKNKGHEFDELGCIFQKNKNILILGENSDSVCKIQKKLRAGLNHFRNVC